MLTIYERARILPSAVLIDKTQGRYTLVCALCRTVGPCVLLTDPTPVQQLAQDFKRGHQCKRP